MEAIRLSKHATGELAEIVRCRRARIVEEIAGVRLLEELLGIEPVGAPAGLADVKPDAIGAHDGPVESVGFGRVKCVDGGPYGEGFDLAVFDGDGFRKIGGVWEKEATAHLAEALLRAAIRDAILCEREQCGGRAGRSSKTTEAPRPRQTLKAKQARDAEICEAFRTGATGPDLAKRYKLSRERIYQIVKGAKRDEPAQGTKEAEILRRLKKGQSVETISADLKVGIGRIAEIKLRSQRGG